MGKIKKNKTVLLLFLGLLVLSYVYLPPLNEWKRMGRVIAAKEEELRILASDNLRLEKEEARLKEDPRYIERLAREKLDLIGEGETLYKIVEDDRGVEQPGSSQGS